MSTSLYTVTSPLVSPVTYLLRRDPSLSLVVRSPSPYSSPYSSPYGGRRQERSKEG